MSRFDFDIVDMYYGAGQHIQKTWAVMLGGETVAVAKKRACTNFGLDPAAMELWRYNPAADTTGSEALRDDMRMTDAAALRLTALLLQHKPLRLKVLCPGVTSSVVRVELAATDSVRSLKAKACAAVGVQPSTVLLWDAYDADDLQPLEQQLGSSLLDANIVQGQALLLELRKPRRRQRQEQQQQPERNVRQRPDASSSNDVAAAVHEAMRGALATMKSAITDSLKEAVARLPQQISQPTCCIAAQQELQQLQSCVVCMDAPRSVLLLPCKHLVLCEKCCQAMQQPAQRRGRSAARQLKPVECPVCRQRAEQQVVGVILS